MRSNLDCDKPSLPHTRTMLDSGYARRDDGAPLWSNRWFMCRKLKLWPVEEEEFRRRYGSGLATQAASANSLGVVLKLTDDGRVLIAFQGETKHSVISNFRCWQMSVLSTG